MNTLALRIPMTFAAILLTSCGGGGDRPDASTVAKLDTTITVPGVGSGTNFSFDLGDVDKAAGRYYFTDRNNKSVDVFDTRTNTLIAQITGGFFGVSPLGNANSGPDGINVIPQSNLIMVGDVNSVKVIDKTSNTVIKNIVVSDSGLRADEGCFDPDHNIYMISSPEESPPFATFISTASLTVIGKVMFPNATGLEACDYNHATQTFLVNNDGTVDAANPHGEVDVIPAGAVTAGTAAAPITIADVRTIPGFKAFAEGNCDPAGLTLGPGNDMAINCRPVTVGSPLNVLIMDRTNGTILATVNAGGGDQIFYDPVTNAYFSGASRWNDTGKTINDGGTCSTALPCKPVLQIIDAVSRTLAATLPAGNNAHSVAVDGVTRKAFMPFSSATAPAGCAECAAFSAAGLAEYTI